MTEERLRLGLLLESDRVSAWMYHAIQRVVSSGCAVISLLIFDDQGPTCEARPESLWSVRHEAGYRILCALDERLFPSEPDALMPRSILELLPDVPTVKTTSPQRLASGWIDVSDVAEVKARRLDIVVNATARVPCGSILAAARYGIWSYCHGDERVKRGGATGFWEAVNNWPETGCTLRVRGGRWGESKVLYRSWLGTYPFLPARNRNRCLWASSSFLARQIALLHRLREKAFLDEIATYNQVLDVYDGRRYGTPSNLCAAWLIARLSARIVVEIHQRLSHLATWYLMFDLSDRASAEIRQFKQMRPPKDRFWADPMVVERDDECYIFIEEYVYRAHRAHIAVIKMDQQGQYTEPELVLEESHHLSYPFIVEWQGHLWMVPESADSRTIDLYKCVEFPLPWRHAMILMEDVQAVDTTLLYHESRWWLFMAIAESEGAFPEVELYLYCLDELLTQTWTPHPRNPIVSDVRRARPAGRIFACHGKLYRPSQDGSKLYGHGLDLNEIVPLSETSMPNELQLR